MRFLILLLFCCEKRPPVVVHSPAVIEVDCRKEIVLSPLIHVKCLKGTLVECDKHPLKGKKKLHICLGCEDYEEVNEKTYSRSSKSDKKPG